MKMKTPRRKISIILYKRSSCQAKYTGICLPSFRRTHCYQNLFMQRMIHLDLVEFTSS